MNSQNTSPLYSYVATTTIYWLILPFPDFDRLAIFWVTSGGQNWNGTNLDIRLPLISQEGSIFSTPPRLSTGKSPSPTLRILMAQLSSDIQVQKPLEAFYSTPFHTQLGISGIMREKQTIICHVLRLAQTKSRHCWVRDAHMQSNGDCLNFSPRKTILAITRLPGRLKWLKSSSMAKRLQALSIFSILFSSGTWSRPMSCWQGRESPKLLMWELPKSWRASSSPVARRPAPSRKMHSWLSVIFLKKHS